MDKPKTLQECFEALDKMYLTDRDNWLYYMDEDEALGVAHHGFGTMIRNSWRLWDETSELHKHFKEMGLFHADDMSSVILTSYHRMKNGKDQCVEEQVAYYKKYWEDMNKSDKGIHVVFANDNKETVWKPADDILY